LEFLEFLEQGAEMN